MDLAQQEELEGRFRIARTIKIIEYARDIWYKQPMNTVSAWESALLEAKKKMEGIEQLQNDLRYTSSYCPTISALRVVPTHVFFYFNYANISWKFNNIMNADEVVYSTISFKKLDTKPFHKEFLKKTRNLYYYLGGSRTESIKIEGNCYLTWVPVGEGCMMIDQKKCKEGFRLHRYQCHDRGKFFKNYKGSWRCHFFPDTDMSFNHVRRMREEWVNILWWDEKRNKE